MINSQRNNHKMPFASDQSCQQLAEDRDIRTQHQETSPSSSASESSGQASSSATNHYGSWVSDIQASVKPPFSNDDVTEGNPETEWTENSNEPRRTCEAAYPRDKRSLNMPRRLYKRLTGWWTVLVHRWWLWELTCLGISCLFMMAAVVTLLNVDGTPLAHWNFPIQLNSMVSVLMTISKSALLVSIAECISQAKWMQFGKSPCRLSQLQLFDDSSRGPCGSLQLLLHPKAIGLIAAAGAFLTIACLTLDPFTQQIIAFPSRLVASSTGSAHIAATQSLNSVDDLAMRGWILNGIYFSKVSHNTFNCTTPTCNWTKPVTSLGLCSACRNITPIVNATCQTGSGHVLPSEEKSWSFSSSNCTYAVNANISFSIYMQTLTLPAANGRHAEYASQYTKIKLASPTIELGLGDLIATKTNWVATFLTYATFFDETRRDMPSISLKLLKPDITACGLYWCGQVYDNPSVVNGSLVSTNPSVSYALDFVLLRDGKRKYMQGDDGRYGIMVVPDSSVAEFPGNSSFTISYDTNSRLMHILQNMFSLSESTGNDRFTVFPEPDSGPDSFTDAVYRHQNVSDTFAGIAKSMTELVRTSKGAQLVSGLALDKETYVQVRWGWMALPLAVLTCVCCLLAITIRTNTRRQATVWKSSSIAVLLHNVDGLNETDLPLDTLEELVKLADRTDVILENAGDRRLRVVRLDV